MSTTLDAKSDMFQRADSVTLVCRTGSASITRLPGNKGSKSIIPRSLTPAPVGHQSICQRTSADEMTENRSIASKTDKIMTQGETSAQSNPGDQTPRSRVSALPTFTGSRRAGGKTIASHNNSGITKSKLAVNGPLQKRQLENQFTTKRQKYMILKKELAEKQKQALDLYEDVSELRDRVIVAGLKDPGKIERPIAAQVKSEGKHECSSICEGAAGEQLSSNYATTSVVTSDFIDTLEEKLTEIPNVYLEVCREALTKRTEIISWIFESSEKNPTVFQPEIIERLEIQKDDNQGLLSRLENVTDKQRALVNELFQKTTALWSEHENYRMQIRELETSGEGLIKDLKEKLGSTIVDLDAEHEKVTQLKERKNVAEGQLQKARTRIRELESHANSNEAKIQQLQGSVKNLETQIKQKEATIEARTKDMHKSMKNSESLVAKTEKQRDSLESRVTELKKKIDSREAEFNEKIKNLTEQLEDTKNQLTTEKDLKCEAEDKVKELTDRCSRLEEKSQQLCDLAETTKDLVVKPADGKHTENEVQLWNELQSTRSALDAKEEQLLRVQREKEKIISTLRDAADRGSPGSAKEKLAAELVTKSEELQTAITEREQLQKSLKTALERSENFEKQLSYLQTKLHAQSKEGGKSGWGAHAIELQQQLCDLRTTLKDLNKQNEELEKALTQKQLELEQRDRIMREQSKVLKVRDELIGLLKGQSSPNGANGESTGSQNEAGLEGQQMQLDPETIGRLVNKQIAAKAEDLQSLYSTLESKQLQLMRLEKVVRQMEDDNDRSQATRTKLEREVAQLRLQLHEKNSRGNRYVGVRPGDIKGPQRPQTSPQIKPGDSRCSSNSKSPQYPGEVLPKLPAPMPIRSRHSSSANSMGVTNKEEIILNASPSRDTPSAQKLNDILRAVEMEKARGSAAPISKRVSRSLRRSGPIIKNSTELREDLYNWLMRPAGVHHDPDEANNNSKREFVRHSRALLNGELSRSTSRGQTADLRGGYKLRGESGLQRRDIMFHEKKIKEGSREFRRRNDLDSDSSSSSPFIIRPDFMMRSKSQKKRFRELK